MGIKFFSDLISGFRKKRGGTDTKSLPESSAEVSEGLPTSAKVNETTPLLQHYPEVLTLEQAAEYLHVTPDELCQELESGRIPGAKLAGKWRIKRDILNDLFGPKVSPRQPQVITDSEEPSQPAQAPKAESSSAENIFSGSPSVVKQVESSVREISIAPETKLSEAAPLPPETKLSEIAPLPPETKLSEAAPLPPETKLSEIAPLPPETKLSEIAPLPPDPRPLAPPPGRLWARVFVYNPEQGYGHARLPDNRIVWVDSKQLPEPKISPFPGDTIEFELYKTKKGGLLRANSIKILPKEEAPAPPVITPPKLSTTELQPASPVVKPSPKSLVSPPVALPQPMSPQQSSPSQPNSPLSSLPNPHLQQGPLPRQQNHGTPKAQELYQKAAVARTEGRIDEARRFFRQALDAGAGWQVYAVFVKMELDSRRKESAFEIIQRAIRDFPDKSVFYEMWGQAERRSKNFEQAKMIFQRGLTRFPSDVQLKKGLAQTLVQIGTDISLKEAGEIFEWLEIRQSRYNRNKLDDDRLYQRYKALQRNPLANKVFEFFQSAGMTVGIAGRRDLPSYATDLIVETNNQILGDSFGLSGAFLVRCFQLPPGKTLRKSEISGLAKYLSELGPKDTIGLQDGREFQPNRSIAFIAVDDSDAIRNDLMSILSENNEAIVPLDDKTLRSSENHIQTLHDLLGQYLGRRDLYDSTMPVSGRRFFGREELLPKLTDEIHHGNFIGIYGLRKMGKTSLVYQLRDDRLRSEAVAYVDLQNTTIAKNCMQLYWELERDLYVRLRDRSPEAAKHFRLGQIERFSELPNDGQQAALLFSEDIRSFLDALSDEKIPGIKRLVIIIDELERILPFAGRSGIEGYLEFFALLRGLAQNERYRGLISSVAVAANAAISEQGYWEGRENPVFALYKTLFLPPLQADQCEQMISALGKGMGVYWEKEATHTVFVETGGHPFLARSLCSRIIKQYETRPLTVTSTMVQEQIPLFVRDEGKKLSQITELLKVNFPEEGKILEQIALDEALAELPDESISHLLGYRLIESDGSGYRVTLNLLRRWLRRQAGIKE